MQRPDVYKIYIHVGFTPALTEEQRASFQNKNFSWPVEGETVKLIFSPRHDAMQFSGISGHHSTEVENNVLKSLLEFSLGLARIGLVVNETKYEISKVITSFKSPRDSSPKRNQA